MEEKPAKKAKRVVDEMERLVMGIKPKHTRKTVVRYDSMYGRDTKGDNDDENNSMNQKFAKEQEEFWESQNAYYGALKKPEENYDGPEWREIVKKGELYLKMELLEEKHGYEWSCN